MIGQSPKGNKKLITVEVNPPFIKLEQFLKLCGAADTGGIAKNVIAGGEVLVDGEICTMRGKKLKGGEKVCFDGQTYLCKVKV
ncbi:MAG TPA: RNA-binding S4 domain-containing protein [Ruminococcaceae bacterium]|nr:RNA-binding S4 domain-containing protein [Oscillospiraceae bacterium]